jgi:acetylornithine deacetylase/succinyl-diaminopimelate desuccinylase-like protein
MNRDKVFEYIDQHIDAHMKNVQDFISQPSISPRGIGVKACGALLKQYFEGLGCNDVGWFGEYPILYGEYEAGAEKTLLVYLMFDTGPSVFSLSETNMYASGVDLIESFGKCITVKGTIGYKAYLRAFLNALESIKAIEGSLPVNLKFVCDGEEMLGSPHLPQFVEEYRPRLETIDAAFWPRSTQNTAGNVQITLGGKGMMGFRLECSGQSWGRGPTKAPSHSSNQVILDSPVWRLVQALATLTSQDGNTVLIDGFYDDVSDRWVLR